MCQQSNSYHTIHPVHIFFKASQPRGWVSGSRAYERHEMQGVILKCTRHECSVFVNLRPLLLRNNYVYGHSLYASCAIIVVSIGMSL